jgi:hypothetical protein
VSEIDIARQLYPPHSASCTAPKLRLVEAAAFLRVSPRSLGSLSWRRRLGIPTLRCGRLLLFDPHDLAEWLTRHAEGM